MNYSKLILSVFCLLLISSITRADEILESWFGSYSGVCVYLDGENESVEKPFTLRIGGKGQGTVSLITSDENVSLNLVNLDRREEIQPPAATEDAFTIPAAVSEPYEVNIERTQADFGEMVLVGDVKTYKVSVTEGPVLEQTITFKVGRAF